MAPRTITQIPGIHIIPWSCEDASLNISSKRVKAVLNRNVGLHTVTNITRDIHEAH